MYRLYLLCAMNAVVFGNSDEAKYIDLLPEAEKQEFLNRIARRIIEEIQGKDIPEQSHAEVSDDQLNAHHTYVHDLIKEESENLRRDYTIKKDLKKEVDNDELEKSNVADEDHNQDTVENSQHIDLTLRNDLHGENNKRKFSADSKFNVIPVKVVYAQDDVKSTESATNNPKLSYEWPNSNSEQKINDENSNANHSRAASVSAIPLLANFSKEKEIKNITKLKNEYNNTQVFEDQSGILSDNNVQGFTSDKQNFSNNSLGNSMETVFSTDTTLVPNVTKRNYDDSFEYTESYTNISISSNKNQGSENNIPTESDIQFTKTTLLPLTTAINTQSKLNDSEGDNIHSPIIYVTTVKSTKEIRIKKKEKEDGNNIAHNTEEIDDIKPKESIKNNVSKKHLRKRLEILSEEYKFETDTSDKHYNKPKQYKNNKLKQYFVYEVPKEKPVFIQAKPGQTKHLLGIEQPYVVPIYNFAPKNAYYNAYNHFGVNNNEEEKIINKSYLQDYEDVHDKDFSLRNGFEIDLSPKIRNYRKNKQGQYKYLMKPHNQPHWEHILNSKFEYNLNVNDHRGDESLRRKIKRDNNFKQSSRHEDTFKVTKIPSKIKYIPLRQGTEIDNNDKPTRQKKQKKHPVHDELRNSIKEDHIRAVKTSLYQQKKLGYLRPSTLSKNKPNKRTFDVLEFNRGRRTDKEKKKPKTIELDYYFGKYKVSNRTDEIDYDSEYADIEDIIAEHTKNYDLTNKKRRKLSMEHYRMEPDDDCRHGCIELRVKKPRDNLDNYVKVLRDMIYRDKTDLVKYEWLLSTVDLESALEKLTYLIETIGKGNKIHPFDLELLKYIVNLYNTSRYKLQNTIQSKKQADALQDINYILNSFLSLLRRRIALPKNKKKKPGDRIANPIQFWYRYYIRDGMHTDMQTRNAKTLRSFKIFLKDLKDNLFELHHALKHISLITTYNGQNWYADLKNIYLKSASKKQLLQVILHLAASKLFNSIEDTAKNAEEDELYINNNAEIVRKIQDEFVFVLKILKQIKKTDQSIFFS